MESSNNPTDDKPKVHISKVAQGDDPSAVAPAPSQEMGVRDLSTPQPPQNIIQVSEQAWIEGTQSLQKNLIRALQEYQGGWSRWKEKGLLAQKRQEMIGQVTEQYVRFLREEARITSDAAFEARRAILQKQLFELKANVYKEIADMAGVSLAEIEQIFQSHYAKLTDPMIQQQYAQFIMNRIADLLDTQNLK
jgi:hypothetical protein